MMPGGENLTVGTLEAAPLDVDAAPDCDVLMTWGDDRPAAWTCARGRGRVAFWNSTLLGTKPFRGHLLQTLALVQPRHVRPLAGWAVVYLDDFPSPASNAELDPIWTELRQTPAEFYAQLRRSFASFAELDYMDNVRFWEASHGAGRIGEAH